MADVDRDDHIAPFPRGKGSGVKVKFTREVGEEFEITRVTVEVTGSKTIAKIVTFALGSLAGVGASVYYMLSNLF